jgi:hypothetical protein
MRFVGKLGGLEMIESQKFTAKLLAVSLVTGGLLLACPTSRAAQRVQAQDQAVAAQVYLADAQQSHRAIAVALQQASVAAADADERQDDKNEAQHDREAMMQDLYDGGQEALDEGHYNDAAKKYQELAKMNGPQTDAALYWLAYSNNKLGQRDQALASISDLKKRYPDSRWKKDAEALEIEMRQNSGHPVNPDSQNDEDLKILALQGIMNNDPAQGMAQVEKFLNGPASPKLKQKALFLLVQSGSPQAQDALARIAKGQTNPELQRKAIEFLGMTGAKNAGKTLIDIYNSTQDMSVKHAVLHSFMISGDRESVATIAKTEKNEELKRDAIRQLGLMGDQQTLQTLYLSESSLEIKKEIIQSLFLSGDSARISELALSEKNPELRKAAIRSLGMMGGTKGPTLKAIYEKETDRSVKEEVLNAYFIGGDATDLVAIAKMEKDPELRKEAVSKLALMNSKEGNAYMMELLNK